LGLVIGKCGNYCSACPWGCYQREKIPPENWDSYRDLTKKYVGYTPAVKPCQSCQTPDEKLAKDIGVHNFVRGCLARKCATHNGIQNCAYCSRYPCDWIEAHVGEITRETVSERIGEPVPDEAYERFIEPFQGKAHLDTIRADLSNDDIVEAMQVEIPVKKVLEFPSGAKLKPITSSDLKNVHSLISNLGVTDFGLKHPDTVAGAGIIKNRRDILYRLIWTVFQNGELRDENSKLAMNSVTYAANKKGRDPLTMLSRADMYFKLLRNLGIYAEMNQLYDDWTTDIGYLRTHIPRTDDPAWELVISFAEKIGGSSTLKALKTYVEKLSREYQARAYTRFSKGDMRFLEA
jgi:hypothetical protein